MEEANGPNYTSDESKIVELFQLLDASLNEQGEQPRGIVKKDLNFLKNGNNGTFGCQQIGIEDGFINYIYRLGDPAPDGLSVVVKWAREIARIAEAQKLDFPPEEAKENQLMLQRNARECSTLLMAQKLVPECIPEIYWLDEKRHFFIMEDLKECVTFRQRLVDGNVVMKEFENIARFFGLLHQRTFISQIEDSVYVELGRVGASKTILNKMSDVMLASSFSTDPPFGAMLKNRKHTDAMIDSGVLEEIIDNEEALAMCKKLGQDFRRVRKCFVHNDSHPGCVMVGPNHDVKVIDWECSSFGNPGKEIGYAMGELIMFYYVYQGQGKEELAKRLLQAVVHFLETYLELMGELLADDIEEFWNYVSAHAGHFAGFRTLGIITFPQFQGLEQAEIDCARALTGLLKNMAQVTSLSEFVVQAFAK